MLGVQGERAALNNVVMNAWPREEMGVSYGAGYSSGYGLICGGCFYPDGACAVSAI